MTFQGAVIKEQGIKFAVVVVKQHVVQSSHQTAQAIRSLAPTFGGIPVVLMAQDGRGTPTYYGRGDIAKFLANVPMSAIPWREYSLS